MSSPHSHFSSGIIERAKGERSWKSPNTRMARISLSPRGVLPFSLGVIITHARVSRALLSLRKNGDYSSSKSESEQSVTVVILKSCITDVSQWSFELKFHKFSHACLLLRSSIPYIKPVVISFFPVFKLYASCIGAFSGSYSSQIYSVGKKFLWGSEWILFSSDKPLLGPRNSHGW